MAIFGLRKPLNLADFSEFLDLYCSKLPQIWYVYVFLLVLTKSREKKLNFSFCLVFLVKFDRFLEKVDFLPVHAMEHKYI